MVVQLLDIDRSLTPELVGEHTQRGPVQPAERDDPRSGGHRPEQGRIQLVGPCGRLKTQGGLTDPGITRDENELAPAGAKHRVDIGECLVTPRSATGQI